MNINNDLCISQSIIMSIKKTYASFKTFKIAVFEVFLWFNIFKRFIKLNKLI